MATEIKVPTLGESVTTATVARWMKHQGDTVAADEPLVELETDKVTVEVNAPAAGVLTAIKVPEGGEVEVGALLAMLEAGECGGVCWCFGTSGAVPDASGGISGASTCGATGAACPGGGCPGESGRTGAGNGGACGGQSSGGGQSAAAAARAGVASGRRGCAAAAGGGEADGRAAGGAGAGRRRQRQGWADHQGRRAGVPEPSGAGTRACRAGRGETASGGRAARATGADDPAAPDHRGAAEGGAEHRRDADHLQRGGHVGGDGVAREYRDAFEKKHDGVRLGFMAFFVRACCVALKEFPAVNAEIDGDDIIYKNFVHMGIAVGGPSGLVVPVIRDADAMAFAADRAAIADFGKRAREGELKLEDLTGGTFSITNGGHLRLADVHADPEPAAIRDPGDAQDPGPADGGGGKVEIRPMMYLAVSYDHRIVDGKEAVSFLVRVKEGIEDPRRLLLGV